MAEYTIEMADNYPRNFVGLKVANAFLKQKRNEAKGPWNANTNSFMVLHHFDITHDDAFDWRAWMSNRTLFVHSVVGPGIATVELCFFNEYDANYKQARLDFVVTRVDHVVTRLHPRKPAEDHVLQFDADARRWVQLVACDGGVGVMPPAHARKTLGVTRARALGILDELEPPSDYMGILALPGRAPPRPPPADAPDPLGGAPGPAGHGAADDDDGQGWQGWQGWWHGDADGQGWQGWQGDARGRTEQQGWQG